MPLTLCFGGVLLLSRFKSCRCFGSREGAGQCRGFRGLFLPDLVCLHVDVETFRVFGGVIRISKGTPIGPIVVPFGVHMSSYKVIPKRNYYGPMGKATEVAP